MRTTMDALKEHKAKVLETYAESQLLGVFVYGSQNYGIDMNFHEAGLLEKLIAYKKDEIKVSEEEVDDLIAKFLWVQNSANQYPAQPNSEASRILDDAVVALITNEQQTIDFYKK